MQRLGRFAASLIAVFCIATLAYGADVTGTVKGADGAPFEGALRRLSRREIQLPGLRSACCPRRGGQYRIPNLPAGEYELRIRAVGYQAQPRTGINLTPDQSVASNLSCRKGPSIGPTYRSIRPISCCRREKAREPCSRRNPDSPPPLAPPATGFRLGSLPRFATKPAGGIASNTCGPPCGCESTIRKPRT